MKRKIMKKIIAITLILIISCIHISSLASEPDVSWVNGFFSNPANRNDARGEAPIRPVEPIPNDPPTSIPDPTPPTPQLQTIYLKNGITGNVFEDYRRKQVGDSDLINLIKEFDEPNIENVIVQLINSNGEIVETQHTDSQGNYKFLEIPNTYGAGNYKVRFIYGAVDDDEYLSDDAGNVKELFELEGNEYYSDNEVTKILKYNGQDYKSVMTGNNARQHTVIDEEILRKGKGCSQVFLVIDCSKSMRFTDEGDKKRIELIKQAAKDLVTSLLRDNPNMYIGIVGFGEMAARRKSLTNDEETLHFAIDIVDDERYMPIGTDYGSSTDIDVAVKLAEQSFVNQNVDTSNRTIILMTDGAPTCVNRRPIYQEDEAQDLVRKIKNIIIQTNNTLRTIESNINLISLITKPQNDFELNMINSIYKKDDNGSVYGTLYRPENIGDLAETLKEEVKEDIESLQTAATETSIIGGAFNTTDNVARRNAVDSNYLNIDYTDFKEFNAKDLTSIGNSEKEIIKNFTEKTYMYAETRNYFVNDIRDEDEWYFYLVDGTVYRKDSIAGIDVSRYDEQNLILTEREPALLELSTKITGFRITLSDGSILEDATKIADVETDINLAVTDIREINNVSNIQDLLVQTLDLELIHGATIELEYTIIVKNTSSYYFTQFSLLNYPPLSMTMDPNAKLLSENLKNKDYGWNNVYVNDLTSPNQLVEETNAQALDKHFYPVTTIDCTDASTSSSMRHAVLGPNGERYVKVVFQTVINSGLDDLNYKNEVEVFNYSNTEGRRMGVINFNNSLNRQVCTYITPANGIEVDFAQNAEVIIIPPTGKWNYYMWILCTLMIVGGLIVRLKLNRK